MDLRPGQLLAHYRLVEKIGEGGMGVVWRAVDTTLGRDVAVKLLPEALAGDAERMQRFEREARVLASLNHPNIATIHGLHETPVPAGPAIRFLVMEVVEGEDLSTRLSRGRMPVEEAVAIATEVAQALAAAHAQGIVHRDLKPANVKLTTGGTAKVLDFGLAKALDPVTTGSDARASAALSPTITSAGTVAGVVLGTAAYMSPEQARGARVDKRADLWALGCLLYEMLTGRRCFDGETISDTLASVLKDHPDWSLLPGETPPAVRRLLRRCLAKDPRQRWSDAADAQIELAEALRPAFPGEQAQITDPVAPARPAGGRIPWIVAAVALVAAAAAWLVGSRPPAQPREPLELAVSFPPTLSIKVDQEAVLEVSPDGRYLVFSGLEQDSPSPALYLRDLADSTLTRLPDTTDGINPFFSPDSRWIAFFAERTLKKIQLGGKSAVPVCEVAGAPRGAAWGDDVIVFPAHFEGGLMQVRPAGGKPEPLTELEAARKERTHRWPQVVSGHDVVLFTVATTDSPEFYDDAWIDALRLSTGERTTVFKGARLARYVSTGHLVVARGGFLYAVPFDIDRLETTGAEVLVREGVMGAPTSGASYFSIAREGLLAYIAGKETNTRRRLKWFHADGRTEEVAWAPAGGYLDPAISPDGKSVAVAVSGERSYDIWVFDVASGARARLTFEGDNEEPSWTPDGKSVVFYSVRGGKGSTYLVAADGSGGEVLLHSVDGSSVEPSDVAPDGRFVALDVFGSEKTDIVVKQLADAQAPVIPFLLGPVEDSNGRFSPDGRFIAYHSDEASNYHVFLRPFPGPGGKWQLSSAGGIDPRWTSDGRKVHFRVNRGWWVVDVDTGDGTGKNVRIGTPRRIRDDLPPADLAGTYAMTPDGKALLVVTPDEDVGAQLGVTVVTDWFTAVERIGS